MATVWINPAFKDKFPEKKEEKPIQKEKSDPKKSEQKKEEKEKPEKKKEEKKKEKSGKKAKKPGKKRLAPPSKMEMKFLQYIEDNNIPVEIKFIGNKAKLTGKIIWSSDHMTCFKPDKKKSNCLIFNRVRLIYYKALEEVPLSANDLLAMSRIKMEKEMINRMAKNFPVEKLEPLIGKIFTEETLEEEIKKLDFTEEEVNKIMSQIKAMRILSRKENSRGLKTRKFR